MGEIRVIRRQGDQGIELVVLGPGEFSGRMAVLQGVRRNASGQTITPVNLLAMSGSDLAASSTAFGELMAGVRRRRRQGTKSRGAPDPLSGGAQQP